MSTTLDEIVIRINELKDAERTELLRRLSELKPKMTNQKDSQPTEKRSTFILIRSGSKKTSIITPETMSRLRMAN